MPLFTDEQVAAMQGFLAHHRAHPQVSFSTHHWRRVREFGIDIVARRRLYLDTCYWIYLRDAKLGRPQKEWHAELLSSLIGKVNAGDLICPISDNAFFELLRQSDPETRLATARLIDDLSLGVTIQNAKDRLQTELVHYLRSVTVDRVIPGPPINLIWLKVGHVLGTPQVALQKVDPGEQCAIAKAFSDLMWILTLEEMLTGTPVPGDVDDKEWKEDAARMTRKCAEYAHEIGADFEPLYRAEIRGFFDVHIGALQGAFGKVLRDRYPEAPEPSPDAVEAQAPILVNTFTNIVRLDKAGAALPMAQIVAGLHAAIRWKRNRSFRSSDFYDFYHAAAALPYCDAFFTEKDMGTALSTPPLSFDERFATVVVWNEAGVFDWLGRGAGAASGDIERGN